MSTSVVEATSMQAPTPVGVVLVMSRLLLISQAVGAALRGRGIDAEAVGWATGVSRSTNELTASDVVLLLDDLEDRESVLATQSLLTHSAAQFLVLTNRQEGAAWGAMLVSGAAAVMPTGSSLAEVESALSVMHGRGAPFSAARRSRLVRLWFDWLAEDNSLRERMGHLSPREREVLDLLSAGRPVTEIVADLGVAETTVRSHIRSVRRKLRVGSQLAAVAAARRLGGGFVTTMEGAPPTRSTSSTGPTLPRARRPEP